MCPITDVRGAGSGSIKFFIPHVRAGSPTERAYEAYCRRAECATGSVVRNRRIFKLWCRRGATDYEAEVGNTDAIAGSMVLAILQLGRDHYTIQCGSSSADTDDPVVVDRHQVYAVTDFSG